MKDGRRAWWGLAGPLFGFLAALAAARTLVLIPGWPYNHAGLANLQMTEVFREAFSRGEIVPLWASRLQNGFGSPFPFFYHRLFSTVAAAASFLFGGAHGGSKAAVVIFLTVGAEGMRRLLRALGLSTLYAAAGVLLLLFANYTYMDWAIRGALSELAAYMLVPWVFLLAWRVLAGARGAGLALGFVLSLVFFAHVAIFLFALIVPGVLAGVALARGRAAFLRVTSALVVSGAVVLVLAGPWALGITLFSKPLSFERFSLPFESVFRNFDPFERYVADDWWDLGVTWSGYSPEIGRFFFVPALVVFAIALSRVVRRLVPDEDLRPTRAGFALFVPLEIVARFLQSDVSAPVYRAVPPARFLQFPWRLLVFETPLVIVLFLLTLSLLSRSARTDRGALLPNLLLLAVVPIQVLLVGTRPLTSEVYSRAEIPRRLGTPALAVELDFSNAYLPHGVALPPPRPFVTVEEGRVVSIAPKDAGVRRLDVSPAEVTITVEAAPNCRVAIAQFATPFVDVDPGEGGRVETSAEGTIVVRPAPGTRTLHVRKRGFLPALAARLFRSAP